MTTTYELQLIPPTGDGPWRFTLRISTGHGPNESWTTPPAVLKAKDKEGALREAQEAVVSLRAVLDRAGV